ncbi:MAG TPA: radical SAM protein [Bacteroidota bacterium]|nr:radical SAM protein [Bacteroidota bacterium]
MKITLCLTQRCNLRCDYCYVEKRDATMSMNVARSSIDFMFAHRMEDEHIDIGIFGGEPLLAFEQLTAIVECIESHPDYAASVVNMTVVTNGTVYSDDIADFLIEHNIGIGVSCDGPPGTQNSHRRFADGGDSAALVEAHLRRIVARHASPMVNAVYRPDTVAQLPDTVAYFSSLGVRDVYLNPDFTARWSARDATVLHEALASIAHWYVARMLDDDAHFISAIDGKLGVILRGGYDATQRCRMGKGEFAISADGYLFPCERLIGDGQDNEHCIGHVRDGLRPSLRGCHSAEHCGAGVCADCGVRAYCMHWCGCSNFMSTGDYHTPGAFLCASERAAISAAMSVMEELEALGESARIPARMLSRAVAMVTEDRVGKGGVA